MKQEQIINKMINSEIEFDLKMNYVLIVYYRNGLRFKYVNKECLK